jgi:hypothetical protein
MDTFRIVSVWMSALMTVWVISRTWRFSCAVPWCLKRVTSLLSFGILDRPRESRAADQAARSIPANMKNGRKTENYTYMVLDLEDRHSIWAGSCSPSTPRCNLVQCRIHHRA